MKVGVRDMGALNLNPLGKNADLSVLCLQESEVTGLSRFVPYDS